MYNLKPSYARLLQGLGGAFEKRGSRSFKCLQVRIFSNAIRVSSPGIGSRSLLGGHSPPPGVCCPCSASPFPTLTLENSPCPLQSNWQPLKVLEPNCSCCHQASSPSPPERQNVNFSECWILAHQPSSAGPCAKSFSLLCWSCPSSLRNWIAPESPANEHLRHKKVLGKD